MRIVLSILASLGFLSSQHAAAASASGDMRQKIVRSISITNVSGLDFGVASPGDPEKTVVPDRTETPENASFLVKGETHASYFIYLPPDNSVAMTTGAGSDVRRRIAVHKFRSFPERFGNFGAEGKQNLYVGATRSAIRSDQQPGDYIGYFTVTVVY